MTGYPLVLASRSPQRRAILEQLGVEFEVAEPDIEELTAGTPRDVVTENAVRKARAVSQAMMGGGASHPSPRVLGVDTAVVLGGRIYGKPRDEEEAKGFLRALSWREHEVWSGIALVDGDRGARTAAAVTRVRFRRLDPADIDWYVASGEWRDRAGGYAIQGRGAALVERIDGDYPTVVGLPVRELVALAPELFRGDSALGAATGPRAGG